MRRFFLIFAWLGACGGQTAATTDGGADGASDVSADAPAFTPTTFAVKRVYLGDADRNGSSSASAWKQFGRNIDALNTTSTSTDVCTLAGGAPESVQADGYSGIDNSWGASILPILETVASSPTPSVTATNAIDAGLTTLLIQVSGLTDDPQQSASGLVVVAIPGGTTAGPAFDASTSWPAAVSETPSQLSASASSGVVTTSSGSTPLVVSVPLSPSITFRLTIHEPVLRFTHADATDIVNGTLSGVLDPNELVAAFDAIAGEISPPVCDSAKAVVDGHLRQAVEILLDGTNQSGAPCTGISIGLGFDAARIGGLAAAPTTISSPPNACP